MDPRIPIYDPTTDTRKRHCRSFSTRKLAERFVDELKYDLANGLSQDKKQITLGDFCQKFLDAKSNKYSLGTLRHYQYTTDRLNAYFSANTPLSTIDEEYAEQFYNGLEYVREDLKNKRTISNSARNVTFVSPAKMVCSIMRADTPSMSETTDANLMLASSSTFCRRFRMRARS